MRKIEIFNTIQEVIDRIQYLESKGVEQDDVLAANQ